MKFHSYSYLFIRLIFSVSLLTIMNGCALFSTQPDQDEDPIARAVYKEREGRAPAEQVWQDTKDPEEEDIQDALYSGEITVGMKMKDVVSLWGHPRDVETAGDPQLGNQKWIYMDRFSRHLRTQPLRVVYFEGGRVVGWENDI